MITTAQTAEIVKDIGVKYGKGEKDTGSASVQVALLTNRINTLKSHFGDHKHDYHSNRGLLKMIGQRRKLLRYVARTTPENYKGLIKDLGLRK